jgi:hypothetical protein
MSRSIGTSIAAAPVPQRVVGGAVVVDVEHADRVAHRDVAAARGDLADADGVIALARRFERVGVDRARGDVVRGRAIGHGAQRVGVVDLRAALDFFEPVALQ